MQQPSMGRIVHFVDAEDDAFPAIIRVTYDARPGLVDLTYFTAEGAHTEDEVPNDEEGHAAGTWHWPERV